MEGAHVRTSKAHELDLGRLVILIGVNVDFVLGVLFPVAMKELKLCVSKCYSADRRRRIKAKLRQFKEQLQARTS